MQRMDRKLLERLLGQGLSLAEIGRRSGAHESTIGYWVKKHGLQAAKRDRHGARGPLSRAELTTLVVAGLSTGQIAERVGRSKTTVRHWLREYNLTTAHAVRRRAAAVEGGQALVSTCAKHGSTTFVKRRAGGYRCGKCRAEAVTRRRRKIKRLLVEEAGGACVLCGYERCMYALAFHHVEPASKRFSLSHRGVTRSLAAARAEASQCVLLCANCHAEVEAGVATVENSSDRHVQCLDTASENRPG
jgi:transposase